VHEPLHLPLRTGPHRNDHPAAPDGGLLACRVPLPDGPAERFVERLAKVLLPLANLLAQAVQFGRRIVPDGGVLVEDRLDVLFDLRERGDALYGPGQPGIVLRPHLEVLLQPTEHDEGLPDGLQVLRVHVGVFGGGAPERIPQVVHRTQGHRVAVLKGRLQFLHPVQFFSQPAHRAGRRHAVEPLFAQRAPHICGQAVAHDIEAELLFQRVRIRLHGGSRSGDARG